MPRVFLHTRVTKKCCANFTPLTTKILSTNLPYEIREENNLLQYSEIDKKKKCSADMASDTDVSGKI